MNFETLTNNLQKFGYKVSCFDTKEDASNYLNDQIDGTTVGICGTMTAVEMNLKDSLESHNEVFWHWYPKTNRTAADERVDIARSQIFITSVNGIAESGEIVNIDGRADRISNSLHGHQKVYFIVGENKIAENLEKALWRARNIAAPKNAQRLNRNTPCAIKGDRCYDCNSEERICRALTVFWRKPTGCEYEVVLIHESLGY